MITWRARTHQQCDLALLLTCPTKRGNSGTRRSPEIDPGYKAKTQVDPNQKTEAQVDPTQKTKAQVTPGLKWVAP